MTFKSVLLAACVSYCLIPAGVNAQARLVEKIKDSNKDLVIPYEKYQLPNGLILIVHEDHSDPIVHVDVTYHVGSAREEIGKSGFAHFFEHMMFQGTVHVPDEQHFKIITEAGGVANGTTNRDRTNYFETVPNNQLEKMLWLEADRMGFLLDSVTQRKFEIQRATVKNERGQRYDNVPYGLVSEVTAKNLYPYGHPYSWLTIGYVEDLNRVNVEDLKNFFMRWYGPNNAVVTVGGDVNTKEVVALVEKYFGPIPKGPSVEPVTYPSPKLEQDRYVSMTDAYAKLPMLRMVYPTVPAYHEDEPALDCLAEILGQGNNSILYSKLIKTRMAAQVNAYNSTSELSGEFLVSVSPYQGQQLADVEKTIRSAFTDFENRGITDDDINKFRSQQEAVLINRLESVSGKVSQLAAYHTFTGNANYTGEELKRYQAVTKEDVLRVYRQYIKGKYAVVLSVLTKTQNNNKAGTDNYMVSELGYQAPDYGYDDLTYSMPADTFDRFEMPGNGPDPVVKVPEYWRHNLPRNIRVIGTHSTEIPVVNMIFYFKGGRMMDAYQPSKAGLANFFAAMMDEDTKNYSAENYSTALEKLGSRINIYATRDGIEVRVRSLRKHLDSTLALLEERLLRSVFTEEAFAMNKKRIVENLRNQMNQPGYVATQVFNRVNYGADNVLSYPASGTMSTMEHITLQDIRNFYTRYFSSRDAKMVVVGDIREKEILGKLKFLQKMPGGEVTFPAVPEAPVVGATKIYLVNIPNAAQTEFRIGYVTGLKYDALGDFYRSTVMNYPLGGAFNSRLNLDLREDKGWTYGARGYFEGDQYTGVYGFSAGIKADVTDSAMYHVVRIMNEYRQHGMTAQELVFTQNSMRLSDARKYETGYQKAGFLYQLLTYDLPDDYTQRQSDLLHGIRVSEANVLAGKYLPDMQKMNVVLVGDKVKITPGLEKLGYEIVELDNEGNRIP